VNADEGASTRWTLSYAPWASAATEAMTTIAASDVPVASRSPKPSHSTSSGTMTVPPPMPTRPLNSPAAAPMAASVSVRQCRHRRHTRGVSVATTLAEATATLRADPARGGVLLDVDGVLAPIVRHAADAHVPEDVRALLIAIARRYGLVACISGRRAADARRVVSLGSITYVGNHGAEILRGGSTTVELDPEVDAWSQRVGAFARAAWSDDLHRLRVRSEDKDVIRAFHWRGAPDEDAAEAAVRSVAERARAEGFVTHWGRKVLEVRPPVALDKGRGVRTLMGDLDLDVALYMGDDRTDVDAFHGLRGLVAEGRLTSAVCVGVRSDETPAELEASADLLVDGQSGVRVLLSALAA